MRRHQKSILKRTLRSHYNREYRKLKCSNTIEGGNSGSTVDKKAAYWCCASPYDHDTCGIHGRLKRVHVLSYCLWEGINVGKVINLIARRNALLEKIRQQLNITGIDVVGKNHIEV